MPRLTRDRPRLRLEDFLVASRSLRARKPIRLLGAMRSWGLSCTGRSACDYRSSRAQTEVRESPLRAVVGAPPR